MGVAGLGNALFNQGANVAELFDRLFLGSELAHVAVVERIAWEVLGLDEIVRVSSFKLSFLCIADTRIKRLLKVVARGAYARSSEAWSDPACSLCSPSIRL